MALGLPPRLLPRQLNQNHIRRLRPHLCRLLLHPQPPPLAQTHLPQNLTRISSSRCSTSVLVVILRRRRRTCCFTLHLLHPQFLPSSFASLNLTDPAPHQ